MSRKATFNDPCNALAARRCRDAGQSIHEIAKSAKKSESTIRRWIKLTYPR
jgi:transposase